jgi:hypothetical protein
MTDQTITSGADLMSETPQDFLTARQTFRDHLRAYNDHMSGAFQEIALANEQQSRHRADQSNPHNVTKAQIGLGNVENRAPATEQDILDLTNPDRLITPATFKMLLTDPRVTSGALLNAVRTPRPMTPTEASTITSTDGVTLGADEYRHMYSREIDGTVMRIPRLNREFEIYSESSPEVPVWTGEVTDGDSIEAVIPLLRQALYRWRCRDTSIDQEVSQWSPTSRFYAPYSVVITPTVNWSDGRYTTKKHSRITTSAFATEGDADVHQSTTWRLFALNAGAPLWEVTSTSDLTSIRLPGEHMYPGVTYQLEVIHHSVGAGDATTGRLTFKTADRFPFMPGPADLYYGDLTTGFYGEVSASEFISGDQLSVLTGFGGGQATPWSSTGAWVKVQLNGQVAYVARYPLRYGFMASDLEGLGLTGEGKEVTLQQTIYRVRSLFGLDPTTTQPLTTATTQRLGQYPENDGVLTQNSEWGRVMAMVLTWLQVNGDAAEVGLTDTYRHNVVAEYPTTDANQPLVVRGGGQFPAGDSRALTYVNKQSDGSITPVTTPQHISWRPVLIAQLPQ